MRASKWLAILGVMAVAVLWSTSGAVAFHDQGVAHCNGCHTMHNSQDGALVDPDAPNGNPWLLTDATPSDTCLGCHADHLGAVFFDDELNPAPEKGGGNFIFLLEDNINDGHDGANEPISGDAAGHNLFAPGHGLAPDATLTTSPGGNFPASILACSSCHDPHGNQSFRLLYGVGRVAGDQFSFTNPAPLAEGISLFFGSEGPSNHTAYESGMSAWCSNCHGDFHSRNTSKLVHPSGELLDATIATNYNLYNGTVAPKGGNQTTAYLAEVPFEDPAVTTSSTTGPTAGSTVMCLSCHRAHASSAPDAGRWDFSVTFLDEDGLESGSYAIPNPYGDPEQRSLCNKCHAKDEGDFIAP